MKNLVEERKYERLRKLGQELHLPIPKAFIELKVFDKDGKLIQRHKQRSHSWVRNVYNLLFCQLGGKDADAGVGNFGAGYLSYKETDGTIFEGNYTGGITKSEFSADSVGYAYRAPVSNTDHGIVVGSGTNAESFEDYELQTLILEGAAAGKLNYVQQEEPVATWTGGTLTFDVVHMRYMNNNSGGNIDVNEVALVAECYAGALALLTLMSRDKLASTVTVPDTGQLKVTYTIQLTYPS